MNKLLYDENGNKINFKLNDKYNHGSYGDIYKLNDDVCLKYLRYGYFSSEYDIESLKTIMNLNLDNFYKIYQLLFNKKGKFKGYLMKYYQKEDIDILTMPTEYTLDNYYHISKSINILTDNNIYASDLHKENVIINRNMMTVVDVDLYAKVKYMSTKILFRRNNYALKYLFTNIYNDALELYHHLYPFDCYNIDCLFMNDANVYNILSNYKYPIDYILVKRRNNIARY